MIPKAYSSYSTKNSQKGSERSLLFLFLGRISSTMNMGGKNVEWYKDIIRVETSGKGLYPITDQIGDLIRNWGITDGICHLFITHTSASLVINESYDPTARLDMEAFLDRLAPEGETWYRHTMEGRDDSPSHLRAILTATSLSIPVEKGQLLLGTWQGVYLYEGRARDHRRKVLVRCLDAA
jgi:secondary thiamine-phosphate synthase enzyme